MTLLVARPYQSLSRCFSVLTISVKGRSQMLNPCAKGGNLGEGSPLPTVLLVDDNDDQLLLFQTILEGVRCQVQTATSAVEALSIIAQRSVDIIVSDVQMPTMDGRELIIEIRKRPQYRKTPIISISATNIYCHSEMKAVGATVHREKTQWRALVKDVRRFVNRMHKRASAHQPS